MCAVPTGLHAGMWKISSTYWNKKFLDLYQGDIYDILVLGDDNIDVKKPRDSNTRKLKNMLDSCKLKQRISTPSRVTLNTSSRIAHIIVNSSEYYRNAGTVDVGRSDHALLYDHRKNREYKKHRNYRPFNVIHGKI